MRALPFAVVLLLSGAAAAAADDTKSVFGTHWVKYEPVQVGGTLKGCSVVFTTVTADRAYLNGSWVALNGSIGLRAVQDGPLGLILTLKIGLKEIQTGKPFERPNFAYLQTANGSTAKAPQTAFDGDPGYKLYTYRPFEPSVAAVLKDLADRPELTIGYNRIKDGIDVLVPLDLTVVDSEYTQLQEVIRKRSREVVDQWSTCVTRLLDSAVATK
jgi:hypothetical protein